MKDLKDILSEGILGDVDKNLATATSKETMHNIIKEYISANYKKYSSLKISAKPNKDGKYTVDAGELIVSNASTMTDFSHDVFVWRNVKRIYCIGIASLTSTKGAPEKCEHFEISNCDSLTELTDITNEYEVIDIKRCNSLKSLYGLERVTGRINIHGCDGLTSLEGAPEKCTAFECSNSSITTLKGAPEECGVFGCYNCKNLTSLEGAPKSVNVRFDCRHCDGLTSLEGAPEKCATFWCAENKNLTSLEGAPEKCREFDCSECPLLTTLEGMPRECDTLRCVRCDSLTTLEHAPKTCKNIYSHGCKNLVIDEKGDIVENAYNELVQWASKYNSTLNKMQLRQVIDRFRSTM